MDSKFNCSKCQRIFRNDENAWKRHTKKCQFDLLKDLDPNQKAFLGSWVARTNEIDPSVTREDGSRGVRYPTIDTLTLFADGSFKLNGVHQQWGGYFRRTGKGTYTFSPDSITLRGEVWRKNWCTRCGDPPHAEGSSHDQLSEYFSHKQFKEKYHRKYDIKCYHCQKMGHVGALCPERSCFICGLAGHIAKKCPNPSKVKAVEELKPCTDQEKQHQNHLLTREIEYKEKVI